MTKASHDAQQVDIHAEVNMPEDVQAGTEIVLTVVLTCTPSEDLRGLRIGILDDQGTTVTGRATVTRFADGHNTTDAFTVKAPHSPGRHTWTLHLLDLDPDREQLIPFSVDVRPASARLLVWEIPSAIPAGDRFAIRVGAQTPNLRDMTGQVVDIRDHKGQLRATARLPGDLWQGTEGLYSAAVELEAPGEHGSWPWTATIETTEGELAFKGCTTTFFVNAVPSPDCTVTVEVTEIVRKTGVRRPLAGLHVLMSPYRKITNEDGIAELKVASGSYRLHVSGRSFEPHSEDIVVAGDLRIAAELVQEIPREHR